MAVELIRLVLNQTYQSRVMNNVFHYHVDGTDNDKAKMVAQAFETQVLSHINQIQNIGVQNVSGYAINLSNPADYWTEPYLGTGLNGVAQNGNPPFLAIAYTINPVASLIRHGYKRIGGIDESFISSGTLAASFRPEVDQLAAVFESLLALNTQLDAIPVIARILQLDPTLVYIAAQVSVCLFKSISTQNTRKR